MTVSKEYLINLCNDFLIPLIKGKYPYHITCTWLENSTCNALVKTDDGLNFNIIITSGILDEITKVIGAFYDNDVDEEVQIIADQIFKNSDLKNDLYECIADSAILFVLMHELSHILRKHLHYILAVDRDGVEYHYSEMGTVKLLPVALGLEDFLRDNFVKMIEFDADAHAIILLNTVSLELYAMLSEQYQHYFPDWRIKPDPAHRQSTSLIVLFGATIALTIIETKPERSELYPSPFARIINLFDAFTQETYKADGIINPDDSNTGIAYLKNDKRLKKIMKDYIFPNFLTALDIVIETCHVTGYIPKTDQVHNEYVIDLLRDFTGLMKTLTPSNLKTPDAAEYNQLRNYRAQFNVLFGDFLNLSHS